MSRRDAGALRRDPLWRALAALAPSPLRIVAAVGTGAAALCCAIGLLATSAWLIVRAAEQPPVLALSLAVVATRAFGIARGVLRYAERLLSHDVALRGVTALRERLYLALSTADPAVVSGLRRGDLLVRVGADLDTLSDLVVRSVLPFAVAAVTATAAVALLAVLQPLAALALAVALVLAGAGAPMLAARAAAASQAEAARAVAATSAETLALLDGLAELVVAGDLDTRLERVARADQRMRRCVDGAAGPAAIAAAAATAATGAAALTAVLVAAQAIGDGALSPVLAGVLVLTPLAAAEAVAGLPQAAVGLVSARVAAVRVLELLDAPAARRTGPHAPAAPATSAAAGGRAPSPQPLPVPAPAQHLHLTAAELACGWPGRPVAVAGVRLDLPPGARVALVGPSGAGKTTILLTLAGLLPPRAGTVVLSGTPSPGSPLPGSPLPGTLPGAASGLPLHVFEEGTLRRLLSFTAEDAHVFHTTVRENLRLARPAATDEELEAALHRAGLGSWYAGLPRGLDTVLRGEGGEVSGGERRRLLLARAVLGEAGVLLLDEPSEHLDPATADDLVRDVLRSGRTVVVATHRVRPLEEADEVLVVDGGRVRVRGSAAWLRAHDAAFAAAWAAEEPPSLVTQSA